MPSIYELKSEFDKLWMILEEELVDDDALLGAFETAQEDLAIKLENCCKYIKNQEALIEGLKEEKKRLNAKQKSAENAIERLKKLMKDAVEASGDKKIPCGTFTVAIQKNPPKLILDVESVYDVPDEFLKYAEPEVRSKDALDAIKAGQVFTWCHSVQEDSLRIR
jgi:hypothetical protein